MYFLMEFRKALLKFFTWTLFCPFLEHSLQSPLQANSLENTILNGISQSAVKICQRDLLKVFALERFTKGPKNSSFQKVPFAR